MRVLLDTNVLSEPLRRLPNAEVMVQLEQRARLEAKGLRPAFADGQIAAIAATQELVLVTRNTRDLRRLKGCRW